MKRAIKLVLFLFLIFNYNNGFSQQQARIYLKDGRVLKYDEIVVFHKVKGKKKGSKEYDKHELNDIYLFEDTDDDKKSSFVHALITYSHKKKHYSLSKKHLHSYVIFTDSLIINLQRRSDATFYYVYDLTESDSKALVSEGLIFKKKENEKFKSILLKHFSVCEAAKEIINKYEGDEVFVAQSKVGWHEVLRDLQDTCPCELFWDADKILERIKELEKKAGS